MKRIKLLIPISILAFGIITAAAFTSKKSTVNTFFRYVPGTGGESNPNNYFEVGSPGECSSGDNICGIMALENGTSGHPVIPTELQTRINERDETEGDVYLKQ